MAIGSEDGSAGPSGHLGQLDEPATPRGLKARIRDRVLAEAVAL